MRTALPVALAYALVSTALWPLPVLNRLHAESCAVIACAAFFAAGLDAIARFEGGAPFGRVLRRHLALLVVPLALLTVPLLWAPNCGYLQGLLFFALFPGVTAVLAVSLAYALAGGRLRRRRLALVAAGAAVVLLPVVWDLGLHPQFYVYNHVFGGVLGPIYDEELALRPGLFWFRGLTLLWALLAGVIGLLLRGARAHRALAAVGGLIALAYLFRAPLGFNTTHAWLRDRLGGARATEHFVLHYDPAALADDELARVAREHEFRHAQLTARLRVRPAGRIHSYLYPDARTKAALTGARYTNVAPVWLAEPQMHLLQERLDQVLTHELAHVFSRSFGLPVLRASLSAGLVEGLAVALEPPDGYPSPHAQVRAAVLRETETRGALDESLSREVAARLSPQGFWTGRGAVSYTTMGSFVRYLLDAYGPEPFKQAYARGRFEEAYGRSVLALAREWERFVLELPVAPEAVALATVRFSQLSLFEKPCPHHVPRYRRLFRRALRAAAEGDTARALDGLDAALAAEPRFSPALHAWADLRLARGEAPLVRARLLRALRRAPEPDAALLVRLADAFALDGRPIPARVLYRHAARALPAYARESAALLALRERLSGRPEVLRALLAGGPPEATADRLAPFAASGEAAAMYHALALAGAGAHHAAARALEAAGPFTEPAAERLRLSRLAALQLRAGRLGPATRTAWRARLAFERAGEPFAAARMADLLSEIHWLDRRAEREGILLARGL